MYWPACEGALSPNVITVVPGETLPMEITFPLTDALQSLKAPPFTDIVQVCKANSLKRFPTWIVAELALTLALLTTVKEP